MIKITAEETGRLAKIVSNAGVPYSAVRRLLRKKEIKLNGKRVNSDLTCEKGDLIEVYTDISSLPAPVFSDENIAVFNKPAGTLSEDFYLSVKEVFPSALAVHRLDRNTRGLIVYALNAVSERELLAGFKNRTFRKFYLAEVIGRPSPAAATLTAYLYKDAESGYAVVRSSPLKGYEKIKTAYKTRKNGEFTSLLDVELITGKTHQIRAHMKFIGNPIVGDEKYGDAAFNKSRGIHRQRLQAYRIVFRFGKDSPLAYLDGKEISVPEEIDL